MCEKEGVCREKKSGKGNVFLLQCGGKKNEFSSPRVCMIAEERECTFCSVRFCVYTIFQLTNLESTSLLKLPL